MYLGLAIHNHQPVDNFPWVFEEAYRQAYLPLLQALERHPGLRLSLHYSGCLLDWLGEHRPDFLDRLAALARRGQVELLTGGYYEPILPAIPQADKLGQIRKLSQFLGERFGQRPEGLWLAERVWEPHLPRALAQAGVRWTVVDDTHFKLAGLKDEDLGGYYMTEEEGYPLRVFPSLKSLRYLIPWKDVLQVMAYLRQKAEAGCSMVAMGDDGEKFGLWPKTYAHCWERGWMEEFFAALEASRDWLEAIPLGEYARRFPPLGTIYLPTASYDEMMEWALPTPAREEFERLVQEMVAAGREDVLGYLRGGFWRNFLAKYPEANAMHKKMLRVHRKVYEAPGAAGLDELWKGQCNCAYWHGVFGGLYLAYMRRSIYHHLLRAENAADAHRGPGWLEWRREDYDGDGREELLVESQVQNLYLHPEMGGWLGEWDLRGPAQNLGATLARRPEPYHRALAALEKENPHSQEVTTIHHIQQAKEKGLSRYLIYDRHPRVSLRDHLLPLGTTLEAFLAGRHEELWGQEAGAYDCRVEETKGKLTVYLARGGPPLKLEKRLHLEAYRPGMRVEFRLVVSLSNPLAGPDLGDGLFASEWNLALSHRGHEGCTAQGQADSSALASVDEKAEVKRLSIQDPELGIKLSLEIEPPATLWRFPVETISSSEEGFERTFQGSCLLILWPLKGAQEMALTWRVEEAD